MRIAVIPARGGSKRVPRKNIRPFFGRPMIAWPIIAARESGLFSHIIVSSDDPEICRVAVEWGAEAPFMRPADISDDHTGTVPVIAHAAQWAYQEGWSVDSICCIYATAPFVQTEDLRKAAAELESGDWAYTFAATEYASPIFRAFTCSESGGAEMLFPEHFNTRSQDLPEVWHDAGQFYWGRPATWLSERKIFAPYSKPIHIPRWRVQDIDTMADWERAELLAPLILSP